ncbi:histidine phosphatase family protein [Arthrobacter sp. GMC3]|uniref:histidine phosphatase family protein n=1 Tax=Arthrobacter sp. GMC3 TaxID=2058894 RepID=UPI000CE41BA5|nr:histidine phosphatase family protein [Arthrobacter sp. GMC3]
MNAFRTHRPQFAVQSTGMLTHTAASSPTSTSVSTGEQTDTTVSVYLTRHGETLLNALKRAQGWSDSPLTEGGRKIASAVGAGLARDIGTVDAVYSADMLRHYETASLIVKGMGQDLAVQRDERLRELAFGGFEGGDGQAMWGAGMRHLKVASIEEAFERFTLPELTDAIAAANPNPELPAEGCTLAGPRMRESLDAMANAAIKDGKSRVLAVSSALSIACLLDSLGAVLPAGGISNGAVSVLNFKNGAWTVGKVNDTSYTK